jgi:hypothetical protein
LSSLHKIFSLACYWRTPPAPTRPRQKEEECRSAEGSNATV